MSRLMPSTLISNTRSAALRPVWGIASRELSILIASAGRAIDDACSALGARPVSGATGASEGAVDVTGAVVVVDVVVVEVGGTVDAFADAPHPEAATIVRSPVATWRVRSRIMAFHGSGGRHRNRGS